MKIYKQSFLIESKQLEVCINICYNSLTLFAYMGSNIEEYHYNNPGSRFLNKENCIKYDKLLSSKINHVTSAIKNYHYDDTIKCLSDLYITAMANGKKLLKPYSLLKNIDVHKAFDEVFLKVHESHIFELYKSKQPTIARQDDSNILLNNWGPISLDKYF